MHPFFNKLAGPSLGAEFPIQAAAQFMAETGEFEHGIAMQLAAVAFCAPGHEPAEIFQHALELIEANIIEVYLQLKYDGEKTFQRLLVRDMTSAAAFEWPIELPAFAFESIDGLAGELYSEYCFAVDWRAYNGDPLPVWADFSADAEKSKQANGWRRAARWCVVRSLTLSHALSRDGHMDLAPANADDRDFHLREKRQAEMMEEMFNVSLGMFKPGGLLDQVIQEQRANQQRQTAALEGILKVLEGPDLEADDQD